MLGAVLDRRRFGPEQDGLNVRTAVASLLALHSASLLAIGAAPYVPAIVTTPIIVVSLTFVPGSLVLLAVSDQITIDARWMVYALGVSLVSLMVVGPVINILLPLVGTSEPLSVKPLATAVTAYVALVAALAFRSGDRRTVEFTVPPLFRPLPLALVMLPLASVLAVSYLNRTGDNLPILVTLGAIALVPLVGLRWIPTKYHALSVWTVALAVLYHKSLWKYTSFAGSPGVVRAWEAGRWTPGFGFIQPTSTELLQNGVLFPTYARLAQIHILTQLDVVNPLFVSFIPVALFIAFRRFIGSRTALLGAALFAFAHPFYMQYPTAGRAATPVLFLALFGVVLNDGDIRPPVATALSMLFLAGLVVSHYGTAYFVATALLGAVGLASLLGFVRHYPQAFRTSGDVQTAERQTDVRLTVGLVGFFLVSALTWYLYLTGGRKFELLPRHSERIVSQLLSGSFFSGRTAARIQRDYGTPSIQYSKYVYLAIGVVIALGFLFATYRYVSAEREPTIDAETLSIAILTFGLFGLTILFRTWGGGRPMMITLVFTAMFAVVGVVWIGHTLSRVVPAAPSTLRSGGLGVFAVVLAALFLLNAGVVSAVGLGGYAPSNVPLQGQFEESTDPGLRSKAFHETDVQTHTWLVRHHTDTAMYGDSIAHGQTDWKLPQIEGRTPGLESYGALRPRNRVDELTRPGVEPGYVVLLGHNVALQVMWDGESRRTVPLERIEGELQRRNRVYTTGDSVIYYANESSR